MKPRVALLCGVSAAVLFSSGCEKLRARDQLNKGVQSFKTAKYADAVGHFKTAVELDPTFTPARTYLATAYMSQYIPGAVSPENQAMADRAKEEFLNVLKDEPQNKLATESIASLHYQQAAGQASLDDKLAKLGEAREWYQKLVDIDGRTAQGHYSLGVIAWLRWYPQYQIARQKMGMKPEDPGPFKDKKIKEELKEKYLPLINDGIKSLQTALSVDNEYDDAMSYLNLLHRERADLEDDRAGYDREIKIADDFVQQSLNTKKIKAERISEKNKGGITTDDK